MTEKLIQKTEIPMDLIEKIIIEGLTSRNIIHQLNSNDDPILKINDKSGINPHDFDLELIIMREINETD